MKEALSLQILQMLKIILREFDEQHYVTTSDKLDETGKIPEKQTDMRKNLNYFIY